MAQLRQLITEIKQHGCCGYAVDRFNQILALLPCSTCNGKKKSLEYAKACPECGCKEIINENLLGESFRQCKNCKQDWWLTVKYAIGKDPCPDCK